MAWMWIPPGRKNYYIAWIGEEGKEIRVSTRTANHDSAKKCLDKVNTEIAEGRFLDKKRESTMTLKAFGKIYLQRMKVAKPRSYAWRKDRWGQVVKVLGEKMTLSRANRPETIELYVGERLGKVSLATVKEDVAVFRHALRLAAKWKGETDLEEYHLHDWRPPEDPNPPKKPEPVDPQAWDELLAKARQKASGGGWGARHGLAVMLLARTLGARRGEVLRLTRANVDLSEGLVRRLVLKKRKIGEEIETAIAGEPLELLREIAGSHSHELLFANPETGRQRSDIKAFWDSVRKAAQVKPKFHGIRHAFGRDYLAAGHDLRQLQERLGHSSITTTEKYAHLARRAEPQKGLPVEMPKVDGQVAAQSAEPSRAKSARSSGKKSSRSRGNAKGDTRVG